MVLKKKRKFKKVLYWIMGIIVFLSIGIAFLVNRISQQGEKKVLEKLAKAGVELQFEIVESLEGKIRIARAGNPAGKKLILVHGSPGDWSAWSNVFLNQQILKSFDVVALDRPGYGKTTVPAQKELAAQSRAVRAIRKHLWKNDPFLIAGHSYGGAVVEQVLLENKDSLVGAIWVAATLSPSHQAPKWYNNLGKSKAINWLLPAGFKSSNKEMMSLGDELKRNEDLLSSISVPVILIQGKKDVLVPFATVEYIRKHANDQVQYVINDTMNHFVPWSHPQLINNAILEFDD